MKEIRPDYYTNFHCLAGKCRHTCCCGWEIDIDGKTLDYYRSLDGEIGARLAQNIVEGDTAHFRLKEERCPFLQTDGLCELILTLGEEHLCEICSDHPRFRNLFSDRTELGLGLCCEAAAKCVLENKEKMSLCTNEAEERLTPEETALLRLRGELMDIAQDRSRPISQRLDALLQRIGCKLPPVTRWVGQYRALERLDAQWDRRLDMLRGDPDVLLTQARWQIPLEQLTVYFLYRHVAGAVYDGDVAARTAFAVLSCRMIAWMLASAPQRDFLELIEIARAYSAEIEYSEENICTLLDAIDEAAAQETS